MSMSREEYNRRVKEIMDYFVPGKEVYIQRVVVTMMSVDNSDQLPTIQCMYTDSNGCLMEISIHWFSLLEALRVMNDKTPQEKPPTTEYVDRG